MKEPEVMYYVMKYKDWGKMPYPMAAFSTPSDARKFAARKNKEAEDDVQYLIHVIEVGVDYDYE